MMSAGGLGFQARASSSDLISINFGRTMKLTCWVEGIWFSEWAWSPNVFCLPGPKPLPLLEYYSLLD